MALIEPPQSPAQEAKKQITAVLVAAFNDLRIAIQRGGSLMWDHPSGVSPADILAEFGTDATTLFGVNNAAIDAVNFSAIRI